MTLKNPKKTTVRKKSSTSQPGSRPGASSGRRGATLGNPTCTATSTPAPYCTLHNVIVHDPDSHDWLHRHDVRRCAFRAPTPQEVAACYPVKEGSVSTHNGVSLLSSLWWLLLIPAFLVVMFGMYRWLSQVGL